ncbi:hypothetical protein ES703_13721 [subsurface metagenome]
MENMKIPTEFKLEDWLPQEPNQGPPLPEWLRIFWPWYKPEVPPGAEFEVSDLIISPTEVQVGYTVSISCTVTNIGTEAGAATVILGGDFMAEKTVTLEPGESKTITFEVVPDVAKSYSISVDGLSGSFVATEEVIDFELARPIVAPAEVTPGTAITITCPVTSRCSTPQTATVKVIIYEGSILPGHGAIIATKTSPAFSISPGEIYNVIVHHTAVAGTIDRRDIQVEVYIAGRLVKESEWDDVYYVVPAPVADIRVENLTIEPSQVYVGEKVTISIVATNYGNATGSKTITCTVS